MYIFPVWAPFTPMLLAQHFSNKWISFLKWNSGHKIYLSLAISSSCDRNIYPTQEFFKFGVWWKTEEGKSSDLDASWWFGLFLTTIPTVPTDTLVVSDPVQWRIDTTLIIFYHKSYLKYLSILTVEFLYQQRHCPHGRFFSFVI